MSLLSADFLKNAYFGVGIDNEFSRNNFHLKIAKYLKYGGAGLTALGIGEKVAGSRLNSNKKTERGDFFNSMGNYTTAAGLFAGGMGHLSKLKGLYDVGKNEIGKPISIKDIKPSSSAPSSIRRLQVATDDIF